MERDESRIREIHEPKGQRTKILSEYWAKFTFHRIGKIKAEPDKLIGKEKAQTWLCPFAFSFSLSERKRKNKRQNLQKGISRGGRRRTIVEIQLKNQ